MIVIRHLDSTGNECDQEIYCDIGCFEDSFKSLENVLQIGRFNIRQSTKMHLIQLAKSDQFNVYENEHIIPNSHWPTIEDFLSEDYEEYCYNCDEKL